MQTPLSVYLLIDKNNRLASEIFNRFYTLLCRDVEKPLSDGLDIPVYLISNDENGEIKSIDFEQSEKNAIFFFADMAVYLCLPNIQPYQQRRIWRSSRFVQNR